jgi:ubiquinone/menaquinone biosynthesis C-methylase UbiE
MALDGWWDEHVVPRIIKFACGAEFVMDLRRQVVPQARGRVFELGCGGGINQPLYDPALVSAFAGLDPSGKLLDFAREAAAEKGWAADIRQGFGEAIPFDDASFDTVVCTFTLCSVGDQQQTLSELRRILKPGGTFLFAEHGRAPDASVVRWQQRIEPVWKSVMGNCHLTRPVTAAIAQAGFAATPIATQYVSPGPRWMGWMEWGTAVRAG